MGEVPMNEKTANGPIGAADAHHPVRKASDYVDDLAVEIATYKARLPELLAHEGEYVLIKGDEVIGFFKTSRAAVRAGYRRFGIVPLLVKQIAAVEPVIYIPNVVL
jgi:hypothetical protein